MFAVALVAKNPTTPQLKALNELNELGKSLIAKSLNDPSVSLNDVVSSVSSKQQIASASASHHHQQTNGLSLNEIHNQKVATTNNNNKTPAPVAQPAAPASTPTPTTTTTTTTTSTSNPVDTSFVTLGLLLDALIVKLETIRPGQLKPLVLYDKNDVRIVMHLGNDSPASNVFVTVLSVTSSNVTSAVKSFEFHASLSQV